MQWDPSKSPLGRVADSLEILNHKALPKKLSAPSLLTARLRNFCVGVSFWELLAEDSL